MIKPQSRPQGAAGEKYLGFGMVTPGRAKDGPSRGDMGPPTMIDGIEAKDGENSIWVA